ncbi:MAG: 30S ribosome-binding factor RbfA [Dehalococcoidia bacterium]|nr:MAG: 30S ribosome-binding factor RbfA [Dehalococcoidia bacterium]UCG82290.1 MAG: 30S ribosome-binding factor RbfA [Dehalococcoidia bacterium]
MSTRRISRVNDIIRKEISSLLMHEIRDPRLGGLLSVTEVDTSPDLKYAKVFVSVMGSEEEKKQVEKGLAAASGYLRRGLGERLTLRYIPQLSFFRDDSIERGSRILEMIDDVAPKDDHDEVV